MESRHNKLKIKKDEVIKSKTIFKIIFKEPSFYGESVLPQKKYNGKFDRVKLYQMMQKEWKKTPILKK